MNDNEFYVDMYIDENAKEYVLVGEVYNLAILDYEEFDFRLKHVTIENEESFQIMSIRSGRQIGQANAVVGCHGVTFHLNYLDLNNKMVYNTHVVQCPVYALNQDNNKKVYINRWRYSVHNDSNFTPKGHVGGVMPQVKEEYIPERNPHRTGPGSGNGQMRNNAYGYGYQQRRPRQRGRNQYGYGGYYNGRGNGNAMYSRGPNNGGNYRQGGYRPNQGGYYNEPVQAGSPNTPQANRSYNTPAYQQNEQVEYDEFGRILNYDNQGNPIYEEPDYDQYNRPVYYDRETQKPIQMVKPQKVEQEEYQSVDADGNPEFDSEGNPVMIQSNRYINKEYGTTKGKISTNFKPEDEDQASRVDKVKSRMEQLATGNRPSKDSYMEEEDDVEDIEIESNETD